jgi:ABC-type nitrate/sulfonate/bicarbonate transport system substrate-binding protein
MAGQFDLGRRLTRRGSLGVIAAGMGSAFVRPTDAADSIEQNSVEIGGVRDPQLGTQLLIADKMGLFKAQGLNVTVHWTESASDIMSFLSGGALYLATSSVNNQVILASKNIAVKAVAGLCDGAGTQGLVLGPGVKLKVVNMEPTEAVTATMRGDVDGALTYDPFMSRLVQLGCTLYVTGTATYVSGKKIELSGDEQLLYQNGMLLSDQVWMEKNSNTLKAVLRAFIAANGVISNDRPKAVSLMREFLHIDATMMERIMNANRYSIALDRQIVRSISFASDWLQAVKRIPAPVVPTSVLAPQLLQEIDSSLVSLKA